MGACRRLSGNRSLNPTTTQFRSTTPNLASGGFPKRVRQASKHCRAHAGIAKLRLSGQVAQMVERSPEKAGVGGSIPSLATTF